MPHSLNDAMLECYDVPSNFVRGESESSFAKVFRRMIKTATTLKCSSTSN
jgi:hypothetical protein